VLGGDEMNERQNKLLKLIIDNYVKSAKPVGSKLICNKLKCSSATVRNEMAELERLGYLEKTHISSGRVPSEKGYRYYVDHLMEPKRMTGEDMLKLQTIFHNKSLELSDTITKSIEIVSELTNYTTIVLGSASKDNKLKQVEVVPLEMGKVIAIIITDKGHVEHRSMNLSRGTSLEELKKTVELINKLLIGTPLDEVSEKLEFEIKPIIGNYVTQYENLYNAFYHVFSDFTAKSNVHYAGKTNMLKQPEFDTIDKVRNILEKLESEDTVEKIVEDENGINVYIGKESEIDEDVAVIKAKYHGDHEEGTIAIVGPKRMEYDRVVSLLEYITGEIEKEG